MPAACKPLILLDFYRSFNDTPTTLEQSLLCSSFSAKSRAPTTCSLACALTTTLVATGFLRLGRLRRPLEDSGVLHLFYQHRTKRNTSQRLVLLFGYLGIVQCSGEVNSLCAKGLRQRRKTAGRRRSAAPPCGAPGCARYLCYFDVPQQTNPNLMPIGDGFNS